ncbi:hypothetical protein [Mycobacterium simulans]|uniref:hypothetical protein n=1 Tax=Mycobacterium simulans TaxID=627089 RepID=UPI00174CF466|nr:hypothetical protein [Mycobacterium simulans]
MHTIDIHISETIHKLYPCRTQPGNAKPRRGAFTDLSGLETAIRTYIDSYNDRAKPFTCTKTADELLGKSNVSQSTTRDTSNSILPVGGESSGGK